MSFFDTLEEMLVILFVIACGYAANRLGILGGETDKKISKLLLNIILPAMVLGSVCTGDALPETSVVLSMLRVALVYYALEFLLAFTLPRLLGGAQPASWASGASPWYFQTWPSSAILWWYPSSGRRRCSTP